MADRDRDRKSTKFQYTKRSADSVKNQARQSSSTFEGIVVPTARMFKPKEGFNAVRILPSTFGERQHYGLKVHFHRDIGPDHNSYLCLEKMKGEDCPICEERRQLDRRRAAADDIKELRIQEGYLYWLIDRKNEDDGPLVWQVSIGMDRDFAGLCWDRRSGEALYIDDPDEGYDIEFDRSGTGLKTKYESKKVARRPSPICDDERLQQRWLEYIEDNPLDLMLQFFDYDHIEAAFMGKKESRDPDLDEDDRGSCSVGRRAPKNDDLDDEIPYDRVGRGRSLREEEEPKRTRLRDEDTSERTVAEEPCRSRLRDEPVDGELPEDEDGNVPWEGDPNLTVVHRCTSEPEPESTSRLPRRRRSSEGTAASEDNVDTARERVRNLGRLADRANEK